MLKTTIWRPEYSTRFYVGFELREKIMNSPTKKYFNNKIRVDTVYNEQY